MSKYYPLLLLTLLTITWAFCNKEPSPKPTEIIAHDTSFPLTFIKEKEKKIDTIYLTSFAQLDDPNHLMICYFDQQAKMHEFVRIDSYLKIEGKFSLAKGQGPRELEKRFFVGGTADEIFIYDGVNRRVILCDKEFKNCQLTRKSLHKNDYIGGFGYSPDTGYFLLAEQFVPPPPKKSYAGFFLRNVKNGEGDEPLFHRLEYKKLERDLNGRTMVWVGIPLDALLIGNFAFIINLKDYTIYKYNLKGRLVKSIKVRFTGQTYSRSQVAEFKAAWGEDTPGMRTLMYPGEFWPACWMLRIGKGFAVARRKDYWPCKEPWLTADYFDLELNYLGKIRLPKFTDWNHPNYSWMAKSRDVYSNGKTLFILRQDEDKEECILEEWSLNYDK